jgi:hypothetical protein
MKKQVQQKIKEQSERFAQKLKDIVHELIEFQKAVDKASEITPVSPEEQAVMDQVNRALGKGDKTTALNLLDKAHAKNIVPDVRYYQIRNSILNVDFTAFTK